MPSTSAAQAKLMSAIAHGWKPIGADSRARMPPLNVAREFHEADKKKGEFMHYKADGGKVGTLVNFAKAGTHALMDRIEGAFHNPYTANTDQLRQDVARYWHMNQPPAAIAAPTKTAEPSVADLTAELHKLASKPKLPPLEESLGTADPKEAAIRKQWLTRQLAQVSDPSTLVAPRTGKWGWHTTDTDPVTKAEIPATDIDRQGWMDHVNENIEQHATPQMADGGLFDQGPPHRVRTYSQTTSTGGGHTDTMSLIRHAADRVSAAVSDDPHHMLARIAGGLTTQLAGLSPSGKAQFGRVPGLVDETKSLPAGLADAGRSVADLGGMAADAAQARGYNAPGVTAMQALRSGIDRLQQKYGSDLDWSRQAGERADKLHAAVGKQMGLSPARGFAEHAADAAGTMLGQLPIVGEEEKAASLLAKLAKSPVEWLSPSVRPKAVNYGMGTLAGAAMGAGADQPQQPMANN